MSFWLSCLATSFFANAFLDPFLGDNKCIAVSLSCTTNGSPEFNVGSCRVSKNGL